MKSKSLGRRRSTLDVKRVKPIEKKLNVQFVADNWDYQKCYFLVEGCSGEKSVKANEAKIVQSLIDLGIGYRKGVFVDTP